MAKCSINIYIYIFTHTYIFKTYIYIYIDINTKTNYPNLRNENKLRTKLQSNKGQKKNIQPQINI